MAGKNKKTSARYAFIALLVALFACVIAALLAAGRGMIAMNIFSLDDAKLNALNIALSVSAALVVIGVGTYAIMSPDSISGLFTARRVRYGANLLITLIAFLGIVFAVNFIAYQNPDLLGSPWDWTEDQSNTLAPETLQTLALLSKPVKATAFYTQNLSSQSAEDLLKKFKAVGKGNFDYEFVDPTRDPLRAHEAGITGDGKILLTMGEAKEVAAYASEQELVKALIRLISPEKRVIYFLQGHGEGGFEMGGELSYSTAKDTLESKNYVVETLNLLTTKDIPEDASLIVVAGPKKPVSQDEVNRLKAYVDGGGSLLVMEDPTPLTEFGKQTDPLNEYLKKDWGVTLNNDVVIDYVNTQNPLVAVSSNVGVHPITQNLTVDYIVILPQARSLTILGERENVKQTALLLTSEQSWGETELSSNAPAQFNEGKDAQGPLTLAVAAENTVTKGRVVVFGNSIFAADNGGFEAYGNGNIFINSVDWAAEQENLINLTVRERKFRVFTPPDNIWMIILIVLTVFGLPGLVALTGFFSWLARRSKG